MKREEKLIKDSRGNDNLKCPECGSDKVWRIQVSSEEERAYYEIHGKTAVRKVKCLHCKKETIVSQKV